MGKPVNPWMGMQKKKWSLLVLALFSLSTAIVFFIRAAFDLCSTNSGVRFGDGSDSIADVVHSAAGRAAGSGGPNPLPRALDFMKSKLVLLVSHELSLSRGPLLLMELAFLLRGVGAEVVRINEPETGGGRRRGLQIGEQNAGPGSEGVISFCILLQFPIICCSNITLQRYAHLCFML